MHLLGISSSPRIGGNTDTLLDEFLRGAAQAGGQVEKISLAGRHLIPCNQCDFCHQAGDCCLDDDIKLMYPKLLDCDVLVLASPIYFMAHCAQAKILIDRCQSLWSQRYILKQSLAHPGRPRWGVFISVGATHGPKVFAGAQVTMKWFFDTLEMEYHDNLLYEGFDKKGSITTHPSALQDTYQRGIDIVTSYPKMR